MSFAFKPARLMLALGLLSSIPAFAALQASQLARDLTVHYGVTDNRGTGVPCADLGADWASCHKAELVLANNGHQALAGQDWALYMHSIRRLLKVDHPGFTLEHLTGDLYKLQPTAAFKPLEAGATLHIPLVAEYWQILESDVIPRPYIVVNGQAPQVIRNGDTDIIGAMSLPIEGDGWKRNPDDHNVLMTPAARFDKIAARGHELGAADVAQRFIPAPLRQQTATGSTQVTALKLDLQGLPAASLEALRTRAAMLGLKTGKQGTPVQGKIVGAALPADIARSGGYRLRIDGSGIRIEGFDAAGVFYGVQSVMGLLPVGGGPLGFMQVEDAPRYDYRGYMVDVARNFHHPDTLRKVIDQMAAYKLNRLHLHLSDDEGWRIQIPGLPELTAIGGQRCHDLAENRCLLPQLGSGPDGRSGSGFLTRKDYIALVRYADARQIRVIPEIDMPAHTRAAVVSMEARYRRLAASGKQAEAARYRLLDPQDTSNTLSVQFYDKKSYLNPCVPGATAFADKVIHEIAAMHKAAGQPLDTWHFGGDEAKNILLGGGFQDKNGTVAFKGRIDVAAQDKPWAKSPACKALVDSGKLESIDALPSWFARSVSEMAARQGATTLGAWQDGVKHAKGPQDFATKSVQLNDWDTLYWGGDQEPYHWAEKGYKVVLSLPDYLYFDFPQEVNPKEPGYYWASRNTDTYKVFSFAPGNLPQNAEVQPDRDGNAFASDSAAKPQSFAGLQGQAWSEVIRTDAQLEYMTFPRLLALAERAWHQPAWELPYQTGRHFKLGETHAVDMAALNSDWQAFAAVSGLRELPKLDRAGVRYRVPLAGIRQQSGTTALRTELPGVKVQYSVDQGRHWVDAARHPAPAGQLQWRTVSADGKRTSRTLP